MIDEAELESGLTAVEEASTWSPRIVSKLEALIRAEGDKDLFRINPIKFAVDRGVGEEEAISLFLHATKAGLFEMEWNIICASCGNVFRSFRNLEKLDPDFRCNLCNMENSASLDDHIHVSFTVSRRIRPIALHDPDALGIEDLLFGYRYSQDIRPQFDGLTLPELMKTWTPELAYIEPGENISLDLELAGTGIMCRDVMGSSSVGFLSSDEAPPLSSPVEISITDEGFEVPDLPLQEFRFELPFGSFLFPDVHYAAPGSFSLVCENDTDERRSFWVLQYPSFDSFDPQRVEFIPFLSARRLLSNTTFHRLFRGQMPPDGEGLSVNDLCYLFTDLEDSTAMYDQIGDATAYNLVRLHFEVLNQTVAENSGAVIKTIGDAIMATFLDPVDAVTAALKMIERLDQFNLDMSAGLKVNIGIHRGHSIAVRLNDRLDYFGQNVNIAARTQQLSKQGRLLITRDVLDAPGVRDRLGSAAVEPVAGVMKGVAEEVQVFEVTSPATVTT